MGNFLGKTISKLTGIDLSDRFGKEWNSLSTLGVIVRMGIWMLRGAWIRWRFGTAKGLFLIGKDVTIRQASYIHVGRNFIAQDHCEINGLSQKGLIFGDNVTIGSHAIIRPTNIYGGDGGVRLKVGNNNSIRPYGYIGCSGYVEIGNNFLISPRVSIYSENHNFSETDVAMNKQGVTRSFFKR
jgi:acetyltransferase-like isoleucine patch superfamily enzyme